VETVQRRTEADSGSRVAPSVVSVVSNIYSVLSNAIFNRVGRIASEDITLQLINTKCIPILLHEL